MRKTILIGILLTATLVGCAPRQAATTWGYSRWYEKLGGGTMGEFGKQQQLCLDQIDAAGDPGAVTPGSPEEHAFFACMNEANWCSMDFNCTRSGA